MLLLQLMSQVQTPWGKTFSLAVLPVGWVCESLMTLPKRCCPAPLAHCPRATWAHCCPWSTQQPGPTQAPVTEMPPALLLALSLLSAGQKDRSEGQMPAHLLPTAATHTPHIVSFSSGCLRVSCTNDVPGQPDPTAHHAPSTSPPHQYRERMAPAHQQQGLASLERGFGGK